jgi:endonuclease G
MNIARSSLASAAIFAVLASPAAAAGTACPSHFLGGTPPGIDREKVASTAVELCNSGYAVLYSPLTNGPIAAAEHLTAGQLEVARERRRKDAFHADERLPEAMRMTLADWSARGSCIDRGHMANDKDQGEPEFAYQTYALSNMVPQDTDNNERIWEGIESAVREVTSRYGEAYVVTGPIFEGTTIQRLNGKVAIPTKLFKAFYVPSRDLVGVYVTRNAAGEQVWSMSLDQLRQLSGIDAFPSLPDEVKARIGQLPAPRPHFATNREVENRCIPVPVVASGDNTDGDASSRPRPGALAGIRNAVGNFLSGYLK